MDTKHVRHYAIQFAKPVPSATWFELAEGMEREMRSKGYDTYEFHLVSKRDRDWMRSLGTVDYLEGHVGLPKSGRVDPEALRKAMVQFLARQGIEVKYLTLDE